MIDADHDKKEDIQAKIDDINEMWTLLKEKTEEKGSFYYDPLSLK